jgi:predicted permease
MTVRPPRIAEWVLARLLSPDTREFVLGDLADDYLTARERGVGAGRAALIYWVHVIQSALPSIRERVRNRRERAARGINRTHIWEESMQRLLQDLRFATRTLRRSPLFALVTVVTLAVGIGANAAIFSVVRAILLAPFPYNDPTRLVILANAWDEGSTTRSNRGPSVSEPELLDFRQSEALDGLGAYNVDPVNLTDGAEAVRITAAFTTAEVFGILGVEAAHGRTFEAEEDAPGGPLVALLSHGLWQSRYGGERSVIGSDIEVDGRPRTVVGIMPPDFRLPADYQTSEPVQLWLPLRLDPTDLSGRGSHYLEVVGRLRDGVTLEQANADLLSISTALIEQGFYSPESNFHSYVVPLDEEILGNARAAVWLIYGAVNLVLLIACANVANLMLARAETRRRELAIRTALGAGRGTLIRQLLTESVILSVIGGGVGLVLGWGVLRALIAVDPASVPRLAEVRLDGWAVLYVSTVSIATGLIFGVVPAIRSSRLDMHDELKESGRTSGGVRHHRWQRSLVAAQVALAVVLVIGATLTVRSFGRLTSIDPGFTTRNIVSMRLSVQPASYPDAAQVAGFYRQLLDRVRALPGVERAGAARVLPLAQRIGDWSIHIEGREERPGEDFDGDWQIATPGYFEAMGIPLRAGRYFEDIDRIDGVQVAVINDAMARLYWPDGALGRRFSIGQNSPWLEIVGVAGDVRHNGISGNINAKWYIPHEQFAASIGSTSRDMTLVVRAIADPLQLVGTVRGVVREMNSDIPISSVQTIEQVMAASVAQQRFTMSLLFAFGAIALLLATIGVYGVMSYTVSERTHELGLRRALGASAGSVVGMVVRQGMLVAAIGIGVGVFTALWVTRFMGTVLYDVGVRDPITFVGVPVLLAIVAVAASVVPARRAVVVEPITALRDGGA